MALATTCPQCKTSFRVVPDQLKLRRGYVRCGRCRHVFAGIEHLRYVDDARLRTQPQAARGERRGEADAAAEPGTDIDVNAEPTDGAAADDRVPADRDARHDEAVDADFDADFDADADADGIVVGAPAFADAAQPDDPAFAPAFPADETPDGESIAQGRIGSEPVGSDPVAGATLDDPPPPHYVESFAGSLDDDRADDESAIDYFSTKRGRGFADRRGLAASLLAPALAIVLAMQWIVAQRSTIAANLPPVAPLLGAALAPFGLRIEAPSELDALTIESFELQASAAPDVLEMHALLRNRADHPVRWPSMQLTLTDPASRVLVRRALHPADYLPEAGGVPPDGVPARTEWPLRLALEARDLEAAGYDYRVQLFYP